MTSSDGYVKTITGDTPATRKIVITGPNGYTLDMTGAWQRTMLAQAEAARKQTQAKADSGTFHTDEQELPGDGGDDGSGGGDDGNGDIPGDGDGDGGGDGTGSGDINVANDPTYENCTANICDPADLNFRRYCGTQPKPQQYDCYTVADKLYWDCEASCR